MSKQLVQGYAVGSYVHPVCFLLKLQEGSYGAEKNIQMEGVMPFIPQKGMEFNCEPFTEDVSSSITVFSVTWNNRDNCWDVWFENLYVIDLDSDEAFPWYADKGWEPAVLLNKKA